jgi:hypothetical protein
MEAVIPSSKYSKATCASCQSRNGKTTPCCSATRLHAVGCASFSMPHALIVRNCPDRHAPLTYQRAMHARRRALECVRSFCGDTIAHVGEWLGDTGNLAFERELFTAWELVRREPLPLWGDTVDDLTIWKRRVAPLPALAREHPLIACSTCGAPALLDTPSAAATASSAQRRKKSEGAKPTASLLRRCRYCRLATYCSGRCADADTNWHAHFHAIKCITIRRPLEFAGRDFYDLRRPYVS